MGIEINLSREELSKRSLMVATPMYGGQCYGTFAKSIADLSALCLHYGVRLQLYFLFNESLITRARAYACDEFLRSECTHMIFIDSDVGFNANDVLALLALQDPEGNDEYDILCGPYPKKCLHHSTKVYTKDGLKNINEIVETKYSGEVLSLDSNNVPTWSKVTNWWKEKNYGKRWVGLLVEGQTAPVLVLTSDHEVAYIEGVLTGNVDEIKYCQAKDMKGKNLVQLHDFNKITSSIVCDVVEYNCNEDSDLYDIEVEGNHNFFTNPAGILVHNCISWEKVKLAVDKGFADQNPGMLENFVGDYVFNPANGTTTIQLDEPAEVLESGTGFMMIRKNTLKRFAEAYPHLSYKPDHVRTEHFDGSREIVMFFDTVIDPESKRYLSEDYFFCQYARKAGMKVWLCPWIQLNHTGTMVFGGSLQALAALGASPTYDPAQAKPTK